MARNSSRTALARPALVAGPGWADVLDDGLGHPSLSALLTVREVAERLRMTPEGVYAITRRGKLRSLALDTGASRPVRRWLKRDVETYLQAALQPWPRDRRR